MAPELLTLLVLASVIALALGSVLTHLAYRAYRRTGSRVLGTFAAGFGLVTLGLVVGGLYQVLGLELRYGLLAQRLLTVAGFALLIYSLYTRKGERLVADT